MNDLIKTNRSKEFADCGGIANITLDKFKRLGQRLDFANVGALQLRIIEIIQLIERPDAVAVVEQPFANVRADKARAAGDEKIHGEKLTSQK